MSTLLENNNNIILRECEMTFIVSTSLYDLKVQDYIYIYIYIY